MSNEINWFRDRNVNGKMPEYDEHYFMYVKYQYFDPSGVCTWYLLTVKPITCTNQRTSTLQLESSTTE